MQRSGAISLCTAEKANVECVVPLGGYEEDSRNARLHQKIDEIGARLEGAIGKPKPCQIVKAFKHQPAHTPHEECSLK